MVYTSPKSADLAPLNTPNGVYQNNWILKANLSLCVPRPCLKQVNRFYSWGLTPYDQCLYPNILIVLVKPEGLAAMTRIKIKDLEAISATDAKVRFGEVLHRTSVEGH